jgi:peptidyl-prolyl cis-trans isomerase C
MTEQRFGSTSLATENQGLANNYHLLVVAQEQFDSNINELNTEQMHQAERVAARKAVIEARVLNSDMAIGVMVPETVLDEAVAKVMERYESKEDFEQSIVANGLNLASLREAIAQDLKVDAVMDRVANVIPAIDKTEASLYYYVNKEKFKRPETRTASHILITINDDYAENTRDNAQSKINEIAERLHKKKHSFSDQASKHSECPTAMSGGLLGKVKKGVLFPELEQVLFRMKEGDLSTAIETEVGLHLLYCHEIEAAGIMPLAEILPRLCEQLTLDARSKYQRQWLAGLLKAGTPAATNEVA